MKQQKITALEGMILTNGEIYGKEIFLGDGLNIYEFYQITQEEYKKIIEQANEQYE